MLVPLSASAKPPMVLEQDRSGKDSDLLELDRLFSGNASDNSTAIRQIILGVSPQDALGELYAPPNSDFFRNSTFAGFLGFTEGITSPRMNFSATDQSMGLAKGTGIKGHLQPVLIEGPKF